VDELVPLIEDKLTGFSGIYGLA